MYVCVCQCVFMSSMPLPFIQFQSLILSLSLCPCDHLYANSLLSCTFTLSLSLSLSLFLQLSLSLYYTFLSLHSLSLPLLLFLSLLLSHSLTHSLSPLSPSHSITLYIYFPLFLTHLNSLLSHPSFLFSFDTAHNFLTLNASYCTYWYDVCVYLHICPSVPVCSNVLQYVYMFASVCFGECCIRTYIAVFVCAYLYACV